MSTHPSCAKPRAKRLRTAATSAAKSPISLTNVNLPPSANEIATSPANAAPAGPPDAAPTLPPPRIDTETGSSGSTVQSETLNSDAVESANTPPPDHEHALIIEEKPHTPLDEESHHQTLPHVVDDFGRLEAPTMSNAMIVDEPVGYDAQSNNAFLSQTRPVPDDYSGAIMEDDILPIPQVDTPPVRQVDTLVNQPIPVLENPEAANPPIQDLVTPDVGKFSPNVHEENSLENATPPVQDNHHIPEYEVAAVDEVKPTDEFIADDSEDIGMSVDGFDDFPGFSGYGEDKGFMGIGGDDRLTDDSESGIKLLWSC